MAVLLKLIRADEGRRTTRIVEGPCVGSELRKCRRFPYGRASRAALVLIGALAPVMRATAQDVPQELMVDLRDANFSGAQINSVRAGAIAVQILPQRDDTAAFVTGAVRIAAPDEALPEEIRKIETFRTGGRILQIGRFGQSPSLGDIQPLVLDRGEIDDLRGCKAGDCEMQIGSGAMEAIHAIDGSRNDARTHAAQTFKELLLGQARAYLEHGSAAMATYNNNDAPESVASAFEQILRDSPRLVRSDPAFFRYLVDFPKDPQASNLENFLYWSKEKVRKPVVSVVHVCLEHSESHGRARYLIAMKHIYDSHYYLAFSEFLQTFPEENGKAFYLVRSIKALIDPPRGLFRGILLGRIKASMRDELAKDLSHTRSLLESMAVPAGASVTGRSRRARGSRDAHLEVGALAAFRRRPIEPQLDDASMRRSNRP